MTPPPRTVLDSDLPVDSPARRRLPVLLRRAWYRLNQAFRRRISPHAITPDQFTVLRTLQEAPNPGLIQSELSATMSSDPNTIASLLDRMEKSQWIARSRDEQDGRAQRIQLTSAGRKKFVEVRGVAVALQNEVLAVLPEEQRELFLEQLGKVADACWMAAGIPQARGNNRAAAEKRNSSSAAGKQSKKRRIPKRGGK